MPLSEAAIMAYEEKLNIFNMSPSRILTYLEPGLFVSNFTLLPHLAQFLHVSALLIELCLQTMTELEQDCCNIMGIFTLTYLRLLFQAKLKCTHNTLQDMCI